MYLSNPEAATFNVAHLTLKIAFLLSILILFYNEFSLHMKSKVRGRRKTRKNATRRTTSKCVFKELAEAISSIIAKFEMEKVIPLQIFFFTFGNVYCFSKLRDKHCRRLSKWQNIFHIKWQTHFTFTNGYFLPFRLLP